MTNMKPLFHRRDIFGLSDASIYAPGSDSPLTGY